MIGYVVTTHRDYKKITLPRLFDSLYAVGIDPIVVENCGGNNSYKNWHFVEYNAFEFAGLLVAAEGKLDKYSHIFLLQDTCEVGPCFKSLVEAADLSKDINAVHHCLCNFGLYRVDFLKTQLAYLQQFKNCTKQLTVQEEGQLYRKGIGNGVLYQPDGCLVIGQEDIYNTGVSRIIEYYPAVDLKKFKSNWGQSSEYVVRP